MKALSRFQESGFRGQERFRSALRWGRFWICVGLVLGLGACSSEKSEETPEPDETEETSGQEAAASEGVQWIDASFEEALAMAREADKMLVVDVWSEHCAQCGIMDEEVWATPEGVELIGDALAVKVPSDAPESYPFRNEYPITGLPAVLLLDSKGQEINRVVGYVNRNGWLSEAYAMMTGVDPIPELQAAVDADPENPSLYVPLLLKYLNRTDEAQATKMKDRILELDPKNAGGHAEKAMREMARYYAFFHMDAEGSALIYRSMIEMFPNATSINAALKGTLDQSKKTGQVDAWVEWVCGQTEKYPNNGRFQSAVAMYAFRNKLTGSCLADAARRAAELGAGPAGIDTVAVALGGGS